MQHQSVTLVYHRLSPISNIIVCLRISQVSRQAAIKYVSEVIYLVSLSSGLPYSHSALQLRSTMLLQPLMPRRPLRPPLSRLQEHRRPRVFRRRDLSCLEFPPMHSRVDLPCPLSLCLDSLQGELIIYISAIVANNMTSTACRPLASHYLHLE